MKPTDSHIQEKTALGAKENPLASRVQDFRNINSREPGSDDLWQMYGALSEEELAQVHECMFFLRHGETVANEQNNFAGRYETPLSELGAEQARLGGRKMAALGLKFDEIHISPLMRTYETAMNILEQLHQRDVRVYVSDQLVERDFGFYSHFNKNLMCKVAGYKAYEESLHSLTGFPPGGETFMEMYRRVLEYYREVLIPKVAEGKTILVVCHKYIVEMFAMIVAGREIEQYHDMRLPNAEALSARALKNLAVVDSKIQKEMADRTIFLGPVLIFAAAIIGAGMKQLFPQVEIPRSVLLLTLGSLLAVSSFFVMLSIHTQIVLTTVRTPQYIFSRQMWPWLLRVALVAAILLILDDKTKGAMWLLLAMPPALTVPVLSFLWGGNLYMAIRVTVLLSCLLPLILPLLFHALGISDIGVLLPFALTLVFSIFLPAGLAQRFRSKEPIKAGKTVTRWKWLSVVSVVLISLISTFYFTPPSLWSQSNETLFAFQKQGLYMLGIMVCMKLFAMGNRYFSNDDGPTKTDFYIAQSTPNIFLWLSIISMLPDARILGFWGCMIFATGILMDEWLFVHTFRVNLQQELCRQAENFWQYKRYRRRTLRLTAGPPEEDASYEAAFGEHLPAAGSRTAYPTSLLGGGSPPSDGDQPAGV